MASVNPFRRIQLHSKVPGTDIFNALVGSTLTKANTPTDSSRALVTQTNPPSTLQSIVSQVEQARERLTRTDDLDRHALRNVVRVVPGPMVHPKFGIESQFGDRQSKPQSRPQSGIQFKPQTKAA